ncbi:hypothetical protein TIFTF001_009738 [Ficus carica]|uniref:Glyoxalase/fosfomycin resistance/dioxygenase domain-containing protein n=1 Tax=Ficus carica TaxID=3494 RepID=A0AA88D3V5_FICCA|nr:hypothetical protein TIFTF001_009738 [Ficus carica]
MAASFRWILQLHKDVPKAAQFYSQGLDFTLNVCTHRWAELQSGPLKLALMQSPNDHVVQKGYSSLLSFTVTDINNTVTRLMALGAELDGPIKYEIHGKFTSFLCATFMTQFVMFTYILRMQPPKAISHMKYFKSLDELDDGDSCLQLKYRVAPTP